MAESLSDICDDYADDIRSQQLAKLAVLGITKTDDLCVVTEKDLRDSGVLLGLISRFKKRNLIAAVATNEFQRRKKKKLDDDPRQNMENLGLSLKTRAEVRRKQLTDQFGIGNEELHPCLLWDVSLVLTLHHVNSEGSYSYMGRHVAEELLTKVNKLEPPTEMTIVGAKGSGKSTIAETIASFMIASRKRAVYFSAKEFIKNKVLVMLHGLFMTTAEAEQSDLNKLEEWNDIAYWCSMSGTKSGNHIYFFVDDFEAFDNAQEEKKYFYEACYMHVIVCIISTNSKARLAKLQSDKDRELLQSIDGPYSEDELQTWVAHSSLEVKDDCDFWVHLDYWTGGMPRLLKLYEEKEGNTEQFVSSIQQSHVEKIRSIILCLAESAEQVYACLRLVTEGELTGDEPSKEEIADLTMFYQGKDNKWHVLCPFLKGKAEAFIVQKLRSLHAELGEDALKSWLCVIAMDCSADNINRARVGWNVESLVLSFLKSRSHVFKDLLEYNQCMEYCLEEREKVLKNIEESDLRKGVLLIPKQYYEKAIDCVYIQWADDKYIVAGIQISVGAWKAKARKESHKDWDTKPWMHPGAQQTKLEKKYYYVMPNIPESSPDFEWKKFSDISPYLARLDSMTFIEPEKKAPCKQCYGVTKQNSQCSRWGSTTGENEVFFCRQHIAAANP